MASLRSEIFQSGLVDPLASLRVLGIAKAIPKRISGSALADSRASLGTIKSDLEASESVTVTEIVPKIIEPVHLDTSKVILKETYHLDEKSSNLRPPKEMSALAKSLLTRKLEKPLEIHVEEIGDVPLEQTSHMEIGVLDLKSEVERDRRSLKTIKKALKEQSSSESTLIKLTQPQIASLVSQITPAAILDIVVGLERKTIDPDIALAELLLVFDSPEKLITLGILLRKEANPNLYIVTLSGTYHIIVYLYLLEYLSRKIENSVFNTVVAMLIISGSDPTLPAVISPDDESKKPSVWQWLDANKITTILPVIGTRPQDVITPEILDTIGILLEDKDIVKTVDYNLAIMAFSNSFIDSYVPETYSSFDDPLLVKAVDRLNAVAFVKLMNLGIVPSYLLMNKLVLDLRNNSGKSTSTTSKSGDEGAVRLTLITMITAAVARGVKLDREQANIISSSDPEGYALIEEAYSQPSWRKSCLVKGGPLTDDVRQLAGELEIRADTKEGVCQALDEMSHVEPQVLINGAVRRQQLKMDSQLGTIREFSRVQMSSDGSVNNLIPNLSCKNEIPFSVNPLEYSDLDLSYYRDEEGSVWCYNSSMYESLLRFKTNDYTKRPLPEDFLKTVNLKSELIRKLRGPEAKPVTIRDSVDKLHRKDTIGGINEVAVNGVREIALINGVSPDKIASLTPETLTLILRNLGVQVDLTNLTSNHAGITFSHIIWFYLSKNPKLASPIFNAVRAA